MFSDPSPCVCVFLWVVLRFARFTSDRFTYHRLTAHTHTHTHTRRQTHQNFTANTLLFRRINPAEKSCLGTHGALSQTHQINSTNSLQVMPNILWELLSYFNDMLASTHTHTHTRVQPRRNKSTSSTWLINESRCGESISHSLSFRHRRENKSTELKEEESEG